MSPSLRTVWITVGTAFVLWFFTFALPVGNFWLKLTFSASLLAAVGLISSRGDLGALFFVRKMQIVVGIL